VFALRDTFVIVSVLILAALLLSIWGLAEERKQKFDAVGCLNKPVCQGNVHIVIFGSGPPDSCQVSQHGWVGGACRGKYHAGQGGDQRQGDDDGDKCLFHLFLFSLKFLFRRSTMRPA
jgi:hypothetical protein